MDYVKKLDEGKEEEVVDSEQKTSPPEDKTITELKGIKKYLENNLDHLIDTIKEDSIKNEKRIRDVVQRTEAVENDMDEMNSKIQSTLDMEHRVDKLTKKVTTYIDESGVVEGLDVNKVPPNILESVYETTLSDAANAMKQYLGAHDAEQLLKEILEDVRVKTSGTEVFKYAYSKIATRNLKTSIEQNFISPKQVHITYLEILSNIKEHVPGYRPKNFKALIKTKSQEYALDRATKNRNMIQQISDRLLKNEQSLSEIKENFSKISEIITDQVKEEVPLIVKDIKEEMNRFNSDMKDVKEKKIFSPELKRIEGLEIRMQFLEKNIDHLTKKLGIEDTKPLEAKKEEKKEETKKEKPKVEEKKESQEKETVKKDTKKKPTIKKKDITKKLEDKKISTEEKKEDEKKPGLKKVEKKKETKKEKAKEEIKKDTSKKEDTRKKNIKSFVLKRENLEKEVLELITKKPTSIHTIKKSFAKIEAKIILEIINDLVDKGKIYGKKQGRYNVYHTKEVK